MSWVDWALIAWSLGCSLAIIGLAFVALWHLSRDGDVPDNGRLLEPLPPPPAGRHRPPRRVPEEYFAAALRTPPGRHGPVVYRSAPTPLPGWEDRTTQQMTVYGPGGGGS